MVPELDQLLERVGPPYDDLIRACIAADKRIDELLPYALEDTFDLIDCGEVEALLDIARAAVTTVARQSVLQTIGGGPLSDAVARFVLRPWEAEHDPAA